MIGGLIEIVTCNICAFSIKHLTIHYLRVYSAIKLVYSALMTTPPTLIPCACVLLEPLRRMFMG